MSSIGQISGVNVSGGYNSINENNVSNLNGVSVKENIGVTLEISNANVEGVVIKKNSMAKAVGGTVSTMALSQSEMVEMQNCLQTLGFLDSFIGFDENNATLKKAVRNFQKTYNISETGIINTNTKNKLRTIYSRYSELNHSEEMDEIGKKFYHGSDLSQRDSFIKTFIFLEDMGLSKAQIAGVMGNMHAESGIIPDNLEDPNCVEHEPTYALQYSTGDYIGFGLLQWTDPGRKSGLLTMAQSMAFGNTNQDIADALNNINVQLAYFRQEMTTTEIPNVNYISSWSKILSSSSYSQVSNIFLEEIEQPSNIQEKYATRSQYAGWIYDIMGTI